MIQGKKSIRLDEKDTVATVIQPVEAGDMVWWGDRSCGICAVTDVPRFHKIAIVEMLEGQKIIKYGQVIGVATTKIPEGAHVHTQNCKGTAVEELKV